MSSDEILMRFIQGDPAAYEALYRKHVNDLYNYGIALGASPYICEDAVHDVFCNLYHKEDASQIKNIKYFLLRSLKNRLIDITRTNRIVHTENIEQFPFQIEVSVMDFIEEEEERRIIKNKVETLMNSLSDRQREAIYLRYMQDLSYEEIGVMLSMTPESARKLVHRGIKKMRDLSPDPLIILILGILFFE